MQNIHSDKILILDFGAQYTQLIARRVRELGVYCEIWAWDHDPAEIAAWGAKGIIFSGGPESTTLAGAPKAPQAAFDSGLPILGICYGMQTMAAQLGGATEAADAREFGHARVEIVAKDALLAGLTDHAPATALDVWMSHGDHVAAAPPGFVVVAVDSSQIEARHVAWLSGCSHLVQAFAEGRDVYSEFASIVFGFPVTKKNIPERFIGKQSILGLGYGLGDEKFTRSIPVMSLNQIGQQIMLEPEEGLRIVQTYRRTYREIPQTWKVLNNLIALSLAGGKQLDFGPVKLKRGEILLPSGLSLYYHDLYQADGNWLFTYGGKIKRLYGGALLENISQSLARIVIMDAAIRIRRRLDKYGIRLALQVHDELVYVVPEKVAPVVRQIVLEEMNRRPVWGADLPLASEAGIGPNYGEAK